MGRITDKFKIFTRKYSDKMTLRILAPGFDSDLIDR